MGVWAQQDQLVAFLQGLVVLTLRYLQSEGWW